MMTQEKQCADECESPGDKMDPAKMPGHWLLARLGKRVLRPGGLELTRRLLAALHIQHDDRVVEFAPGLGATARLALQSKPATYTAVERDAAAASQVQRLLEAQHTGVDVRVITGLAQETGLPDSSATVVYGEAMLTMQTETRKRLIVREAFRLLRPGGRYGIHELGISPGDLSEEEANRIRQSITTAIHHQALPLTMTQWDSLLSSEGFEITHRSTVQMALLEPARMIRDEGFFGALRFACRLLRDREARRRVLGMRKVFREHRHQMNAICLVATKPLQGAKP